VRYQRQLLCCRDFRTTYGWPFTQGLRGGYCRAGARARGGAGG
jgi:hypothetical protein